MPERYRRSISPHNLSIANELHLQLSLARRLREERKGLCPSPFVTDATSALLFMMAATGALMGLSHIVQPRMWIAFFGRLHAEGTSGVVTGTFIEIWPALIVVTFRQVWSGPAWSSRFTAGRCLSRSWSVCWCRKSECAGLRCRRAGDGVLSGPVSSCLSSPFARHGRCGAGAQT